MPENWRIFLHPRFQRIKNALYTVTYALVRMMRPVRPNSVILATNRTEILSDNLRYVYDHVDKDAFSVTQFFLPSRPTSIVARLRRDLRFIAAMAQTQYTIVDDFLPLVYPLRLRPDTRLVQVWHALGALKRVGYSRRGKNGGPPPTSISHKNYTDVIVSAEEIRKDFAEAFGVAMDIVHATGAPRSDLFFDQTEQDMARERLYRAHPILEGRRVILFAPTFRGREKRTAHYPEEFLDLDRFGEALGPDDLVVLKMHPFIQEPARIPEKYADRIIDLSDYPEFNHLLLICDLLITDYSSAIFDYSLLKRPIIFYVPDLEHYQQGRGFYYDFGEYTYGPVVHTFTDLLATLDTAVLEDSCLERFHMKFLANCDGHATQRFIDTVLRPTPMDPRRGSSTSGLRR
ncbi:MAG: CDP-glycerol glycerophosphotransferase family protein [Propionibacteriaceae bacterium]|nr:CDP-glycerol glycerophosphotransferase family protein [Propionibacteriaceae bacterium]